MSIAGFVISLIAVIAGAGVVSFRNPLFSAFSLVVNLLAVSGLYAVMGAHFLAASQVMVYAGAIMVLVLFVLMLLNMKTESPKDLTIARGVILAVCAIISLVILTPILLQSFSGVPEFKLSDNMMLTQGTVKRIGLEIYQHYVVHFELASLVILVGVVGAVMLANRRKDGSMTASDATVAGKPVVRSQSTVSGEASR